MKRESLALAIAAGLTLSGPVAASIEFYDRLDSNGQPMLDTPVLVGGKGAGAGLPSTTIDIYTNRSAWTGYAATLELLLSDDEEQPDGEHAVVANLINDQIEITYQDTIARWYTWAGDVESYLQVGSDSNLFFSELLTAHPDNKDFYFYNARLVFTVVPEASQWLLFGAGLLVAGGVARRRGTDVPMGGVAGRRRAEPSTKAPAAVCGGAAHQESAGRSLLSSPGGW